MGLKSNGFGVMGLEWDGFEMELWSGIVLNQMDLECNGISSKSNGFGAKWIWGQDALEIYGSGE